MRIDIGTLLEGHGISQANLISEHRGGNSRVFKVVDSDGTRYAIKCYLGDEQRKLRSMEYEIKAHNFFDLHSMIPKSKLNSYCESVPSISYTWIEGESPIVDGELKRFLSNTILRFKEASQFTNYDLKAIDAFSSSYELLEQLEDRQSDLNKVQDVPVEILQCFQQSLEKLKVTFPRNVNFPLDTLSLSDYGPHNIISDVNGNFVFIDFEFFGRDSTAKLICDLYCHPRTAFNSRDLFSLVENLQLTVKDLDNILLLLPAVALKWAYIVMRRAVDWETLNFIGFSSEFDHPFSYFEYMENALSYRDISSVLTILEYKSM
jgi:hypothetical protein